MRKRREGPALMQREEILRKIVVLAVFSLFCFTSSEPLAQAAEHVHEPHSHRHMQYAKEKNPVPANKQSIKKGADIYEKHCIGCHGKGGKAAGNLDLTKTVFIHGDSDGEIFHVITDGVKGTSMKGFKKELTKDMRWHLVNYIRSQKRTEKRE